MPHRKVIWESALGGLRSVRLLRLRLARFEAPLHAHDAIELTWIERGQGLRWIGHRVEPFGPDDLVLLGPRVAHSWQTRQAQPDGAWATVLQLLPGPELAALPEWRELTPLLQRAAQGLALHGATAARVQTQLASLSEADGLALVGGALVLLGELGKAHHGLRTIDPAAAHTPHAGAPQQRRLDALLSWMHANLGAELRVADAAALLHVSPAAFSRSFQRLTGRRFADYLNELRVGEACVLLLAGDRPVAEVAQQVGFATLSHFNAQFRLRTGETPKAYRSQV